MSNYEIRREDGFLISTDKSKLQFDVIHGFLRESYWSPNIPIEKVKRAAEGSMCFGIYNTNLQTNQNQVGYARIISDFTTFAYLADVFVLETERNKGVSKFLMASIMSHPELQGLRRWMLATRDAHGLYAQFGFEPIDTPETFMQIVVPNIYNSSEKK